MQDFTRLRVWERANGLALAVYEEVERWGRGHGTLAAQARRAAVSIGANITEGCGKDAARDFARFLDIARGSTSELEHHLRFASDLGLVSPWRSAALIGEAQGVRRMLTGLIAKVRLAERSHRPPATEHGRPKTP